MKVVVGMALTGVMGLVGAALQAPTAGADTGTISGAVFDDANRNAVRDSGEAPFAGRTIEVYDSSGTWVTGVGTNQNGDFVVSGLSTGTYDLKMGITDWWDLRENWVPTATDSLLFQMSATIPASAPVSFGLRRILRSRTLGEPISAVRMASGTLVESYNDVVTATEVASHLQAGSLLGAEAPYVELRFDFQTGGSCTTSVTGSPGSYSGFGADVWVDYLSWIGEGDRVLFHEYGHAFSRYHDYVVQQDGDFSGYLEVRGLQGDPRLGTSRAWSASEMVAEDFRQLFGSPSAQAYPQENAEIPTPYEVSGLEAYLRDVFTRPPTSDPPPPNPSPDPTLTLTGVAMSPDPVSTEGFASLTLSSSATVDVAILDNRGAVVRALASDRPLPTGTTALLWDRTSDTGRRAKAGTYRLVVAATDAATVVSAEATFDVTDPTKPTGRRT